MWSICLVITDWHLSRRGQGHVSNFYILVLKETHRRSACRLHLRRPSDSWLSALIYYTLDDCNPLTPLLVQVVRTLLCSNWQDFDWHSASRCPSAAAEVFVGININKKLSNPRVVYFLTSPKQCPALPCEIEKTQKLHLFTQINQSINEGFYSVLI